MSKNRQDIKQLAFDFKTESLDAGKTELVTVKSIKEVAIRRPLTLVVNNSARPSDNSDQGLKPNSPEMARIIRSMGEKLGW